MGGLFLLIVLICAIVILLRLVFKLGVVFTHLLIGIIIGWWWSIRVFRRILLFILKFQIDVTNLILFYTSVQVSLRRLVGWGIRFPAEDHFSLLLVCFLCGARLHSIFYFLTTLFLRVIRLRPPRRFIDTPAGGPLYAGGGTGGGTGGGAGAVENIIE